MSKPRIVLVLGDDVESQLVRKLSGFGITPILHKDDMRAGLNKIRHERFDAVFLDRDHLAEADVIEFTLNVRDFDPHIPIIAAGKPASTYEIQASDGELGHVDDYIFDDETWTIRYLVVDTKNWLPGRKVLVAPLWIENINWAEAKVHI